PAAREQVEETFAGLRFVRNWGGYHADPADFIQPPGHPGPARAPAVPGRLPAWTWRSLPEPALGSLPPRGRAWEMTRYRAYRARLAGRTIGETFGLATEFLELAYAAAGVQRPQPASPATADHRAWPGAGAARSPSAGELCRACRGEMRHIPQ
ncbi:MAG: hypothetical protein J2P34_10250, partial [Actinobacteria bacterium]|nr:hypothetical protein [Actinomycetota bacterium]